MAWMLDRSCFSVSHDFAALDAEDKRARWAMTPAARLASLELLRRNMYPDGKTAPRIQRIFEVAQCPWG